MTPLLFGALVVLCGRTYIGQRLNLSDRAERILRAQIGPQLEKQLGERVEFGRVETDWLGRVTVRDIFIGRDARLPTGALLRAQSATLELDLPGIALGRAALPGAVRSVSIQNPQIYLRRDARGFNLARLLPKKSGGPGTRWNGQVTIVAGRVYYLDTTLKNAAKEPLLLDARGIDAQFSAAPDGPYRGAARIKTPLLGARLLKLNPINADGSLQTDAKNGLFTLETTNIPFAPLASYAFAHREIVARTTNPDAESSQTAANSAAANPNFATTDANSDARTNSGLASAASGASSDNPNVLTDNPGAQTDNSTTATDNSTTATDNSTATSINSGAANANAAANANFGGALGGRVTLVLARGALEAHGALSLRDLAFSAPSLRLPGEKTALKIDGLSGPIEFAGEAFSTTGARFRTLGSTFQVAGAASLRGDLPFDLSVQTPALPLAALRRFLPRGASFSARNTALRAHLSGNAGGKTRAIDARGALETAGAGLSFAPNRARAEGQTLRTAWAATANLRPNNSLANWKIAARAVVSNPKISLAMNETAMNETARGETARGETAKSNAAAREVALTKTAPTENETGRIALGKAALTENEAGEIALGKAAPTKNEAGKIALGKIAPLRIASGIALIEDAAGDIAPNRIAAGEIAPVEMAARGAVFTVRAARGAGVEIGVEARTFSAISPRFGRTEGQSLRVLAGAPDAARPTWSGSLALAKATTNGARWSAFSPALARTLRSSGDLDLSAQFAGLDTGFDLQKVRLAASFGLSDLQLNPRAFAAPGVLSEDFTLRDADFALSALRGRASLSRGVVSLSRAAATSSFGPLRLDASVPLRAPNAARVALSLPDVRLDAARFAPFLRAQQLNLSGDWRGRVTLLSAAAASNAAQIPGVNGAALAPDAAPRFSVDLALRASASTLRGTQNGTRSGAGALALQAPTLRVRGDFAAANAAQSWSGSGILTAQSATLRGGNLGKIAALPVAASGARAAGIRLDFALKASPAAAASSRARQLSNASNGFAPTGVARLGARSLSVPLALAGQSGGGFLTLQNLGADLENGATGVGVAGVAMPRFAASFAGGEVRGTARLTPRGPQAQLLARGIDAARLQQLVAAPSRRAAQLAGRANALIEVRPGAATRAQIRLDEGTLRVAANGGAASGGVANGGAASGEVASGEVASGARNGAANGLFNGEARDMTLKTAAMARGAATDFGANSAARTTVFPLQNARATLILAPDGGLQIRGARVWSDGARFAGAAAQRGALWRGQVTVTGAPLGKLAALPWAPIEARRARAAGVGSGDFDFAFDARRARLTALTGRAQVQLGEVYGAQINDLSAQVSLRNGAESGERLSFAEVRGEIEGAPVQGAASADLERNFWNANLRWSQAQSARLARLQALLSANFSASGARDETLARAFPITGALSGAVQLSGTLRDARGAFSPRPRDGFLRLDADDLVWRGRGIGDLKADIALENGVLRARTLQLTRAANGFGDATNGFGNATNGAANDAGAPLIEVSGTVPLDANAPGLDAQIHIASAPLAFFTGALAESRETLRTSGVAIPFFERVVSYVEALPASTSGQLALDAALSGTWGAPRVSVSNLTLREGRTRLPSGGFSPPATLDAAFVFDQGTVTIEKAEFRLKKAVSPVLAPASFVAANYVPTSGAAARQTGRSAPNGTTSETATDATKNVATKAAISGDAAQSSAPGGAILSADAADDEDDTLLRIEPGGFARPDGPIELAADVINANLSQLAPWVPALRGSDGAPLLRGELSEFSFRVGGTTRDPAITGSIQGENLQLQNYTLDRLRVSRFEVGNGAVRIEPGNLTVVKGAFQSSAPYGSVPWSWAVPGPVLDGPIDVHFPLQTKDFGALVGAFVPALSVADAGEFNGSIDVGGTLRSPDLSGAITIRDGQFRLDEARGAVQNGTRNTFAAGLRAVSGTVRFVGATQVLIDADDPLRGQIVPASAVVGRASRRAESAPVGSAPVGSGAATAISARTIGAGTAASRKRAAASAARSAAFDPALKLAGEFVLRGSVVRPAQVDALLDTPSELSNPNLSREERRGNAARLRALLDPTAALSRLKYDLSLELERGAFASGGFGGVSEVSAGVIWKTAGNSAQNVRWMLAARGQKTRASRSGGDLTSFGAVALRRDFGSGFDALARSGARDFSGEADFASFGVAKRVDVARAPDRRAQVSFNRFAGSVTGAGNGVLDGRLVLDNGAAQQKAPTSAVKLQNAALLQNASLQLQTRRIRPIRGLESDFALSPTPNSAQIDEWPKTNDGSVKTNDEWSKTNGGLAKTNGGLAKTKLRFVARNEGLSGADDEELAPGEENETASSDAEGAPLRLGGVLTLSDAELYGAPTGGEGGALLLSGLPGAPRFDVRLKMGRDVQVVTAAFRSGLEGELVASGTPSAPQISGILTTRGGQVRFPNARARVDEGRVTLALGRDAQSDTLRTRLDIDATARGQAGRYAITLRLRGPLDLSGVQNAQTLQIDVTSNPPLSQSEALQQLLGTAPDLDYDQETGTYKVGSVNRAYTNAVLNVLSAPLFSGVEQTLAQTLGLTSVGFQYRFNEPLAVQITKALGDRIFVSYRRSLGSGPTASLATGNISGRTPFELRIEYRIKGNYLLGLQTDERQIPSLTLQKTRRF